VDAGVVLRVRADVRGVRVRVLPSYPSCDRRRLDSPWRGSVAHPWVVLPRYWMNGGCDRHGGPAVEDIGPPWMDPGVDIRRVVGIHRPWGVDTLRMGDIPADIRDRPCAEAFRRAPGRIPAVGVDIRGVVWHHLLPGEIRCGIRGVA